MLLFRITIFESRVKQKLFQKKEINSSKLELYEGGKRNDNRKTMDDAYLFTATNGK